MKSYSANNMNRLSLNYFWQLSFLIAMVAGCSKPAAIPTNTLIYGRGEDSQSLDPINTDIGESVKVIVNLYDRLVTYHDETLELIPSLATEWDHSEDGLTWTFQLREGVKFHDGEPFNAEAVVFTFKRLIEDSPEHAYVSARPYKPNFNVIEDVVAKGEYVVEFKLKQPSAIFLQNLAMFPSGIVSPTAVMKHKEDYSTNPVGTGPFRFVKWQRDQQIVLEAFDDYWRGRPAVDRIVFVPVSENATRVQQLRRGSIHIADNLPPIEVDALDGTPGIVLQEQIGMNVGYLTIQTEKPPLDNVSLRQAIGHAIDKTQLVKVAYAGHAKTAKTMVPPTMWGHHEELVDREFDLERAKELMQQAQQEAGVDLPLQLTLSVMSEPRPYMQDPLNVASFIKDSLAEIGLELTIDPKPANQHFAHLMSGGHQLGLAGWTSDNNDPDNFLYTLLDIDNISEHGNNLSCYRNEYVHELLLAGQSELDVEARFGIYKKVQEQVFADAPVIPLVHTSVRVAQRDVLKGYKLHPSALVRLRLARIEAGK